jgi:hypothetical protein
MSESPSAPRWRVLVTPRWISWHLFAVAAVIGMIWLGDWQLRRALSGNILSWAYTFEWPIFAVFGVVFWIKTVRDELRPRDATEAEADEIELPASARAAARPGGGWDVQATDVRPEDTAVADAGPEDTELAEYNAYLARLSKEARGHGKWHGLR